MWSRPGAAAVRVAPGTKVASFWDATPVTAVEEALTTHFVAADAPPLHMAAPPASPVVAAPEPEPRMSTAEIERDAFMKGYAQGERAGNEAAAKRGEATLRRMAQTVEELAGLRTQLVQRTERQVVELALTIAERILHREVALDQQLLVTMARVAIERLGENMSATIRLNPEDYAIVGNTTQLGEHSLVRVVADPTVSTGGCLVQSEFGLIDVGIEAQVGEMAAALGIAAPSSARSGRGGAA